MLAVVVYHADSGERGLSIRVRADAHHFAVDRDVSSDFDAVADRRQLIAGN